MWSYIMSSTGIEDGALGVTWVLLAVLIGSLVYWAWPLIRPRFLSLNIPPFPAPRRFVLGHILLWSRSGKNEVENVQDFREKAGDLFSLDLAGNLMIVVSGYEKIKQVLVKSYNEAPDRPKPSMFRLLNEDNHGLIASGIKVWKEQRTTSLMILRALGMGKNSIGESIQEEVSIYTDKLAALKGEPSDIHILTKTSVSNIICSILVGKRFDHDDPDFITLIDNMDYLFTKAPPMGVIEFLPFLFWVPVDPYGAKRWFQKLININEKFSKAHISKARRSSIGGQTESYITAYLRKIRQENAKGASHELDDTNLVSNIRSLFIAGTETTSTTIYWCVLFCLHHPYVQDKVFEEISAHVGENRLPTMSDRPNLRYLDAVIRETQRYASIAPLLARKACADFEFSGYTIPKGSTMFINLHSVLHDQKTWGDPEKFRPERFLDAHGNLLSPEEFIPFGLGRRVCLGEALAKMELFLFLSAMFQRFRFEPEVSSRELPPLRGNFSIVLKPDRYKARFVPRCKD